MSTVIVHGHFYQPPRENPWTGIVEAEPSAAPFHDWNERIHSECYGPNASAQITDPMGGEDRLVNNYANINFNFGPTLLSWLEQNHPDTYARIIAADRDSALKRGGHGNAIAQAYGHAILPLCNERDRRTQICWGVADFRYRFGREPQALWLPETACSDTVLDALIDEGLRFVILAPHQAARVRASYGTGSGSDTAVLTEEKAAFSPLPMGEGLGERAWRVTSHPNPPPEVEGDEYPKRQWRDVDENTIDTGIPYRFLHRDGSARSIAVFFYDRPTSRAIAFENLLKSSRELADRFVQRAGGRELLNIATDGETYGHHFKFGDVCLAHALEIEAPARGFEITNYSEYLDEHPPAVEVQINSGPDGDGTSWSCPHGVGRWIRDCGCHTGGERGWHQAWRTPLREALDFLRDNNVEHFEATRGQFFTDPWKARDESIALILDQNHSREQFLYEQTGRWLSSDEQWRALMYLELQRMLLLMYTSCGWFFNDISGIETIQILKYAARAVDLMEQLGLPSSRERFLDILAEAKSNKTEMGTGADIFQRFVEPLKPSRVQEPMPA